MAKKQEEKDKEVLEEVKGMTKGQIMAELSSNYGVKQESVSGKSKDELVKLLLETKIAAKEIEEPEKEITEVSGTVKEVIKAKNPAELKKKIMDLQKEGRMVGYHPDTHTAILKPPTKKQEAEDEE